MPTTRWTNAILLTLAFLAFALPRWAVLSRGATADEAKWSARSANFLAALGRGDLGGTYQSEHPGVTTMWAGALGLLTVANDYANVNPGPVELEELGPFLAQAHGRSALDALAAGRAVMVLFNALALTAACAYAAPLLGLPAALLGGLLIAFSPFFAGHTHLLHLDGLVSSFILLALLAYLRGMATGRAADMLAAGIAAGLSWLTKTPALFLLPFMGGLALAAFARDRRAGRGPHALWFFLGWTAVAGLTFVLLWPAMWVAPLQTVRELIGGALGYAGGGHADPVFFNGRIYSDGSIPATAVHFYPLTYLWRATPLVVGGLALAAYAFWRRWPPLDRPQARHAAAALLLFALSFGLFMTLGDKKFDRYLLPAYPPLALIAAAGWTGVSGWLARRRGGQQAGTQAAVLLVLVAVLQLASLLSAAPAFLSYYSPLPGGPRRAPQVMQIGWGEGLDEAAAYLKELPGGEEATVASWYRSSFATHFDGPTLSIKADPSPAEQAAVDNADYIVIYIHQWQRDLPPDLLARLRDQEPRHTVWINGLAYAQIYERRP